MSKLYNRAFKVGVAFTIGIFAILNVASFIISKRAYDESEIRFSHSRLDSGVPFSWAWDTGIGLGFMLNVAAISLCAFVVGFLFRYFLTGDKD